jgi:hypothetical protein
MAWPHDPMPQIPLLVSQAPQPAVSLEGLTFIDAFCSHDHVPPTKVAVYCSLLQVFEPLFPAFFASRPLPFLSPKTAGDNRLATDQGPRTTNP